MKNHRILSYALSATVSFVAVCKADAQTGVLPTLEIQAQAEEAASRGSELLKQTRAYPGGRVTTQTRLGYDAGRIALNRSAYNGLALVGAPRSILFSTTLSF